MLVSLCLPYPIGALYCAVHRSLDHYRGWWGVSGAVRGTVTIDGSAWQLFAGTADCHVGTHHQALRVVARSERVTGANALRMDNYNSASAVKSYDWTFIATEGRKTEQDWLESMWLKISYIIGRNVFLITSATGKSVVPLKIWGSTPLRIVGTFNHYIVQNHEKSPSSNQIPMWTPGKILQFLVCSINNKHKTRTRK